MKHTNTTLIALHYRLFTNQKQQNYNISLSSGTGDLQSFAFLLKGLQICSFLICIAVLQYLTTSLRLIIIYQLLLVLVGVNTNNTLSHQ